VRQHLALERSNFSAVSEKFVRRLAEAGLPREYGREGFENEAAELCGLAAFSVLYY
jgi:hypothetical protein